jgi:hypothetical protein
MFQWVFSENIANIFCQQVIKWQLLLQVRTHLTTTSFDLAITMPALPGVNIIKLFLSITDEGDYQARALCPIQNIFKLV